MNILLAALLLFSYIPHAQHSAMLLNWSYPFNDSTYRHYRAINARIDYITELGEDGFIDFDANGAVVHDVVLHGDADAGDIQITPLHASCWRVTMETDYSTLQRVWGAVEDFQAVCYTTHLPLVLRQ